MARNREKHESLVYQVEKKLKSKMAIGQSKHDDKLADKAKRKEKRKTGSRAKLTYEDSITMKKIYTWNTFRDYLKHACYFAKWCKEHYGCRTLDEYQQYVDEWLTTRLVLSPYTQKLEACALAKVYDCSSEDFIKTGVHHRAGITRSRKFAKRDKIYRMLRALKLPEWKVHEMANCRKGYWRVAKMLNSVLTNRIIARLGYISMSDYYLKICEN